MLSRRRLPAVLALLATGIAKPAYEAYAAEPSETLAERNASRFPQPVRVGDLIGRPVLEPTEAQSVLGHVSAVSKLEDGHMYVVVSFGGTLGIGARPIAVPAEAVALAGQSLVVVDFTPEQLRSFPTADDSRSTQLDAGETIRMGLVRPFH